MKVNPAGSRRAIRWLASHVATKEGQIAELLLLDGRGERASVNLISQASCLIDADRKIEARCVLEFALECSESEAANAWIAAMLAELGREYKHKLFLTSRVNIDGNDELRKPQKAAYHAARSYFSRERARPAIIQLPVGCGKTGTMALMPFEISSGRVLVIVPNLEILRTVQKSMDASNTQNFWKKTAVFANGSHPTTAVLEPNANIHDCDSANILLANIQQLATTRAKWLDRFGPRYFDLILVDEAHHAPAPSWKETLSRFPKAKVVSFTATPLRSDGQPVDGELIYRYPIASAIREGYIKDIASRRLAPTELRFTSNEPGKVYSIDEVVRLKETTWFSRGVALSRECNEHIVDASIQSLRELRSDGTAHHQIIAAACSIDHAKSIRSLYEERGLRAAVLHSKQTEEEQGRTRAALKNLQLDVICQVSILNEGADYPNLSVAAIFRPFRHIVPYIQFIGRVMRVIKEAQPGHPDNRAYVISHLGLNVDRWWEELRSFDQDDRSLLQEVANGSRVFSSSTSKKVRRFRPDIEVVSETIDSLVQDHYLGRPLSVEERQRVIDDLFRTIRLKGFDPEELGIAQADLERQLGASEPNDSASVVPFIPQPVQPQRARQQARRRLNERTRSAAKELLNRLGLQVPGRELVSKVRTPASDNLAAAIVLLNLAVNRFLDIDANDRDSLDLEELRKAHDGMDEILDQVVYELRDGSG
ncbi:MAG: DEAD/DEAH box helicase [Vulcanimicrobiota bacterium]